MEIIGGPIPNGKKEGRLYVQVRFTYRGFKYTGWIAQSIVRK